MLLTQLQQKAKSAGGKTSQPCDGGDCCHVAKALIIPLATCSKTCRLFDFIPSEHQGPPTHYAIHTHGAAFQSTLKQLLAVASTSSNVGRVIFVWIDFVAISQHRQFNNVADLNLVKKVVNSCTCGEWTEVMNDMTLHQTIVS